MSHKPVAFMTYARFDDKDGKLSQLREQLSIEVQRYIGEPFPIFQDHADIAWGQNWQERINESVDAASFLILVITPSFFNSESCCDELARFLERERDLGRTDLVLPIYYVDYEPLDQGAHSDPELNSLIQAVSAHQYVDWRDLRFEHIDAPPVRRKLAEMAQQIRDAWNETQRLDREGEEQRQQEEQTRREEQGQQEEQARREEQTRREEQGQQEEQTQATTPPPRTTNISIWAIVVGLFTIIGALAALFMVPEVWQAFGLDAAATATPTRTPEPTTPTREPLAPTNTPTPTRASTQTPTPTREPPYPYPEDSLSAVPESEGKIAFSSKRDGNWEIYVMNADGTNVRRLTDEGGSAPFLVLPHPLNPNPLNPNNNRPNFV